MTDENLTNRLQQVEAHVAHLERQSDELNTVLLEQSKLIARLQKTLASVTAVIEATEQERLHQTKEKPPHYAP